MVGKDNEGNAMQGISNERCDMEYVVWWQSQCLSKSIEEEPKKGSTSKIFEVHIIYIYIERERDREYKESV